MSSPKKASSPPPKLCRLLVLFGPRALGRQGVEGREVPRTEMKVPDTRTD